MKIIEKDVSNKIANASIVCALLVVLIHTNTTADEGSAVWWVASMFSKGVGRMAVPFFFMISGYFLAGHFHDDCWWRRETLKRVRSLLIPYFCWLTLYIGAIVGLRVAANLMAGRSAIDSDISNWWFYLRGYGFTARDPMMVSMWYLRGLFVIVLLSPLIKLFLRFDFVAVVVAFVFGVVYYKHLPSVEESVFASLVPSTGIAYFVLGTWLRIRNLTFVPRMGSAWLMIAVGIAFAILRNRLYLSGAGEWIEFLSLPGNLLLIFGILGVAPCSHWPKWITSMSFPVYCVHLLAGLALSFMKFKWLKCTMFGWCVCAAYMMFVSSLATIVVRRFMPRVASILFGGR